MSYFTGVARNRHERTMAVLPVPALAPEDDEQAAREWLDENARQAGELWAERQLYGGEVLGQWREPQVGAER